MPAGLIRSRLHPVHSYLITAATVIGLAGDAGQHEDVHREKTEEQLHRRKDNSWSVYNHYRYPWYGLEGQAITFTKILTVIYK